MIGSPAMAEGVENQQGSSSSTAPRQWLTAQSPFEDAQKWAESPRQALELRCLPSAPLIERARSALSR